MATIIKTSGEQINIEPRNGKDFKLKEMQAVVSGFIEIIYLSNDRMMVINEEGKIHGLGINWAATEIFQKDFGPYDVIVGDVLICKKGQIK